MSMKSRAAALVERMWESDAIDARVSRFVLSPAESLFALAVRRRNRAFDAVVAGRGVPHGALPTLSVGNLTVGGTGKTPVAAWCVQQLIARGGAPAIVMRGYGDDEWREHALLNRGVPVIVSPDRSAGVITARARGANCVVLDDAFQHRQTSRLVDLVLISADQWVDRVRLLPAGPFREPLSALTRADVAVVTVKAADASSVAATISAVQRAAPRVAVVVVRLAPSALRLAVTLPSANDVSGHLRSASRVPASLTHPVSWLKGRTISVATAIGNPTAFERQLRAAGALIRSVHRYSDHHAFSAGDAAQIAEQSAGVDGVLCTLKDAVKLGPLWPREAPPLWYVSQTVVVERGAEALDRAFARVLAARAITAPTAG